MKFPILLVAGSLAANAALVAVYVVRTHPAPASATGADSAVHAVGSSTAAGDSPGAATKATVATARTPGGAHGSDQTWAKLNSADLRALAARLKAAGFPATVVRAIINAQIAESFKARRDQLMPQTEDKPFWKTEGSGYFFGGYDPKLYAAMRELSREQTKQLKDVLGDDYRSGEGEVSDFLRRRYGDLPKDKIDQLQRIDEDYSALRQELNAATRGIILPEDRQKIALLEQEKRADLAQLLSPPELEDYLMRTSQTTMRLRRVLANFDATENEFLAIYKPQAAFDEKYAYENTGSAFTPELMQARQEAQKETFAQIKAALGDERYAEYIRAGDREFQQISRLTQQANLPDSTALQVYGLRDNVSKESNRIYSDAALTNDQKRAALQTLAQNTRTQIATTLGAEAGATYLKVADRWLSRVERGSAVTFNENNGISSRTVPTAKPPAAAPATTAPAATTPAK